MRLEAMSELNHGINQLSESLAEEIFTGKNVAI